MSKIISLIFVLLYSCVVLHAQIVSSSNKSLPAADASLLFAPGDLDPAFGAGGKVTTPALVANDFSYASALMADGRIVVLCSSQNSLGGTRIGVARFNPNGSLDTSFAGDGTGTYTFGGGASSHFASNVAVQPDGKIVIVGEAYVFNWDIGVLRLNANGTVDTSFDGDGTALISGGPNNIEGGGGLHLSPLDGKILVSGVTIDPSNLSSFLLKRLNPDGSPDLSFGFFGEPTITPIVYEPTSTPAPGGSKSVVVASDGKIYSVGHLFAAGSFYANIVRYNVNGFVDTTYDGNGILQAALFSSNNRGTIQSDGKLLVAGSGQVLRFNVNGTPDLSFDVDGRAAPGGFNGQARQQPDGRIVWGGYTFVSGQLAFIVSRLNADGSFDSSFGSGGTVTTEFLGDPNNGLPSILVQPDSKIVFAGSSLRSGANELTTARYLPDGQLDGSFAGTGVSFAAVANVASGAFAALPLLDRVVVVGYSQLEDQTSMVLMRYLNNGNLDAGFNGTGKVFSSMLPSALIGYGAVAQPNGKVVTVAEHFSATTGYNFHVRRFETSGAIDSTYNTTSSFFLNGERPRGLVLQSDGKAVAAGWLENGPVNSFVVRRYTDTGLPDGTFDTDGRVSFDVGSDGLSDQAYAVAMQSDGKIVVAGSNGAAGAIVRLNSDGSQDGTALSPSTGTVVFKAVKIQPDGKIVAAGYSDVAGQRSFYVARFNPDLTPDLLFGTAGSVTTPIGTPTNAEANALAIQAAGGILVSGKSFNSTTATTDFTIVRYSALGVAGGIGSGGIVKTDFGFSEDVAHASYIDADGKLVVAGQAANKVAVARYSLVSAPTAAPVSISGRVTTAEGRGVSRAVVTLTGLNGETQMALSNPFGYYRFTGVVAGSSYTVSASSKRYEFAPVYVVAVDDLTGVDLVAVENF